MPEFYHSQQIWPWLTEEVNRRMEAIHLHGPRMQVFYCLCEMGPWNKISRRCHPLIKYQEGAIHSYPNPNPNTTTNTALDEGRDK